MKFVQLWISLALLIRACNAIHCINLDRGSQNSTEKQCKSKYNACGVVWNGPSTKQVVITQQECWIDTNDNCTVGPCVQEKLDLPQTNFVSYFCCCRGDFCNRFPETLPEATDEPSSDPRIGEPTHSTWFIPGLIIPCVVSVFATVAMVTYCALRRRRRNVRYMKCNKKVDMKKQTYPKMDLTKQLCSTYGSFSNQIWLAAYRSNQNNTKSLNREDRLTVRVSDQASAVRWSHESHLLSTITLSHPHIACALWWGKKHHKSWLVYDNVFVGTLTHVLQNCTLSIDQVKKLSEGIFSGLAYLHCTIHAGSLSKPALAHRDMRSDNIFLKHSYVPVLGNFHCATPLEFCNFDNLTISVENISKLISTNHYLAPELFTERTHYLCFNSFRQIDVYSTSLVIWQILNRCTQGGLLPYSLPYQNIVGDRPTLEDISSVIKQTNKQTTRRPPLHAYWKQHPELKKICYVLQLCWTHKRQNRLTAHYLHRIFSDKSALDKLCGSVVSC